MTRSRFEILTSPERQQVKVGNHIFSEPHLARLPEANFAIKSQICGEPDVWKIQDLHKWYCERLGPRFNRRFQAANYYTWIAPHFTEKTAKMLRCGGHKWRHYDKRLVLRAHSALPYIQEAERDGLYNLVPLIVSYGAAPSTIRKMVGRGPWKRLANNSVTRNCHLMRIRSLPHTMNGLRSGILAKMHSKAPLESALIAASISPTVGAYEQTSHVVRDAQRMLGPEFNASWSLARIVKEHERATRQGLLRHYSCDTFGDPLIVCDAEYSAIRLTSAIEIAEEGATQKHCVASYAKMAERGDYEVFTADGPQGRFTIGAVRQDAALHLDQVYAACNQPVSPDARRFAHEVCRLAA